MSHKQHKRLVRHCRRIFPGSRKLVGGLVVGGLAAFATPNLAKATHPPTFVEVLDGPFHLTDVGTYASPSFADLDADGISH